MPIICLFIVFREGPELVSRGQKSLKLSNSMTCSDQNCLMKGAYFATIFLWEKFKNQFSNIFINSYNFVWYNTAYITDYEILLFSLDQKVTQLSTTLSLKMSSRSKINCGQLNTVDYALYNHITAGHSPCSHWTVGHTL